MKTQFYCTNVGHLKQAEDQTMVEAKVKTFLLKDVTQLHVSTNEFNICLLFFTEDSKDNINNIKLLLKTKKFSKVILISDLNLSSKWVSLLNQSTLEFWTFTNWQQQGKGYLETISLSTNNVSADKNLKDIKNQVSFIHELSQITEIRALFKLLKQQTKKFKEVKNIFLQYMPPGKPPVILFFQGTQIYDHIINNPIQTPLRIKINDKDERHWLANELSRPFSKLISFPLISSFQSKEKEYTAPIFYIEHGLVENKVKVFVEYMTLQLQLLSMALDRILLEEYYKSATIAWENTFSDLESPISIIDEDKNILRANKAFYEKVGDFKNTKTLDGLEHLVFTSGEPQTHRLKVNQQIFDVYSYPIQKNENDSIFSVINYYVDLTEQERLRGQFIQNEKMAAIGHLADNIAHELNNPLTGIRSMAQILIHEDPSETLKSDLMEVEKAAERCQEIVTNLLDFSKHDELTNKKTRIDINDMIQKTIPLMKAAFGSCQCELELTENIPLVLAEPQLMQQVIFNLINNANQALDEGGRIEIKTQVGENNNCLISVVDNGCGIDEELIDQIFQPFFTTKVEGRGTGLGLSMCKSVIEEMKGHIQVKSQKGQGTEFTISLPGAL